MQTGSLKGIEIFKVGEWNGYPFIIDDLNEMVKTFYEFGKERLKPFLKLGHSEEQLLLQRDGYPSAGWVSDLRVVGDILLADILDVPKVLLELIDKKAYKRISVELMKDYIATPAESPTGERVLYPWLLTGIALLGADTPAVTTLSDIASLYYGKEKINDSKFVLFTMNINEEVSTEMNEETKNTQEEVTEVVEEVEATTEDAVTDETTTEETTTEETTEDPKLEEKFTQLEEQMVSLESEKMAFAKKQEELAAKEAEFNQMKQALEDEKEKAEFAKQKAMEVIENNKKKELETFINSALTDNKIVPAEVEVVKSLLEYSQKDSTKLKFSQEQDEMLVFDLFKKFISDLPDREMFKSSATTKKINAKDAEKLILEYAKKHEVDYGTAQLKVRAANPDMFEDL